MNIIISGYISKIVCMNDYYKLYEIGIIMNCSDNIKKCSHCKQRKYKQFHTFKKHNILLNVRSL